MIELWIHPCDFFDDAQHCRAEFNLIDHDFPNIEFFNTEDPKLIEYLLGGCIQVSFFFLL